MNNLTKIIPTDLSGYCDIETGECIVETSAPSATESDDPSGTPDGPEGPGHDMDGAQTTAGPAAGD